MRDDTIRVCLTRNETGDIYGVVDDLGRVLWSRTRVPVVRECKVQRVWASGCESVEYLAGRRITRYPGDEDAPCRSGDRCGFILDL